MIIDTRIGGARTQFATQLGYVPQEALNSIKELFVNDETPDFYEGLLAGFVAAYQIVQHYPHNKSSQCIGAIIAYISNGHLGHH